MRVCIGLAVSPIASKIGPLFPEKVFCIVRPGWYESEAIYCGTVVVATYTKDGALIWHGHG